MKPRANVEKESSVTKSDGRPSNESAASDLPPTPAKRKAAASLRLTVRRGQSMDKSASQPTTPQTPTSPGGGSAAQPKKSLLRQTSLPTGWGGTTAMSGTWLGCSSKRQNPWGQNCESQGTATNLVGMSTCGSKRTGYGRMPAGWGNSGNVCAYRSFSTVGKKNKRK